MIVTDRDGQTIVACDKCGFAQRFSFTLSTREVLQLRCMCPPPPDPSALSGKDAS
jgi:RNase P subunit RPR2